MKKLLVYSLLFIMVLSSSVFAKKAKNIDVKSTEGVEVSQQTAKTVKKSKFNSKAAKQRQKNRNKYLRYLNKTNKAADKKITKERDLELLNKRLEIKKKQLEELTSEESEKGAN